ncbi:MAG: DUF2493 domain-containing protein [Bacillota bacterium]|nr:DUF2493 domain-containing protein [Bacillota bacterium]
MFRVIVAGSRNFSNFRLLEEKLDKLLRTKHAPMILSGAAPGADRLGEKYAAKRGFPLIRYPAQWSRYGIQAAKIRNAQMAEEADAVVVFWDGKSSGSRHMIQLADRKKLPLRVIRTDEKG